MVINLEFDLKELENICGCIEYCLKNEQDVIKPNDREDIRKLGERLRNTLETCKDIKRESAN